MKIGIDLLWVKVGKCGGTESYIRNILNGFTMVNDEHDFVLFVASDNMDSFKHYEQNKHFSLIECKMQSEAPMKRLIWEDLHLAKLADKNGIDVMFIPVYSKPWAWGSKIPYVTTFHDLQALYYPQYFSKVMYWFMKYIWWYACKTSVKIIGISEYVARDIEKRIPVSKGKVVHIYNPIITNDSNMDFDILAKKYNIEKDNYYYCVSSLLPHKNLETVLKAISVLKKENQPATLVLSGVGGQQEAFDKMCKQYDIEDRIIQTGFVSDEERDCLYENCQIFLFPSIFEGFGMPPIEVMRRGKHVITTRKTCIEEVTESKAIYVDDPFDEKEWALKIKESKNIPAKAYAFEKYNVENIAKQYLDLLTSVVTK